jgi:hypothetical protein
MVETKVVEFTEEPTATELDFSSTNTINLTLRGGTRCIDMSLIQYPPELRSLTIISYSIKPAQVPLTLTSLTLKATEDFARNFTDASLLHLPDSLEKLCLYGFHLKSIDYILPSSLIELTFGGSVFSHYNIPKGLKKLHLYGNPYGGDLLIGELPEGLEELSANSYKGALYISYDYPKSLKKLTVGSYRPLIPPIWLSQLPNLEEADTLAYSIPIKSSSTNLSKWSRNGEKIVSYQHLTDYLNATRQVEKESTLPLHCSS